jgi:hypothetical protein
MKKLFLTALLAMAFAGSVFAQDEVIFTIMKTDGSTTDYVMNKDARIYYSDTQLLFFNGNETVAVDLSGIRKAYFTAPQDIVEVENQQLTIYPNPAKDVLRIENIADNQEVSIYSINGALLKKVIVSDDAEINISELRPGMYVICAGNMFSKFIKM